ncbi:hypothetical protein E3J48_08760 [Candidatus Aerophobetes bacterium]|uniref:Uncharacterized protein n=1 Tax=Aerophobetes bacterium TaxID=2030807 RepID=A0A523VUW4_UNCAE|nr:MAG: hypothetical protein E3J48_08760 [Candidatus Aerophobetes bacterium]
MKRDRRKDKSTPFIIMTSFFFSFLSARLWVVATGADSPVYQETATYVGKNLIIKGLHVHHFFYGFVLLCVGGWLALNYRQERIQKIAALVYGVGLGFFMDEIGFLLTWGEYWSSLSYAVALLTGVLFLNVVYFADFWSEVRKNIVLFNGEHPIVSKTLRIPLFMEVVDKMSTRVSRTEKVSLIFTGLVYMGVGAAILIYPVLLYIWVAAGFILGGVSYIVRAIRA